jgi:hypothetical protein
MLSNLTISDILYSEIPEQVIFKLNLARVQIVSTSAPVPYTSYLSQKEHKFHRKINFGDDLKLLKLIFWGVEVQGVKSAPLKKS